MHDPSVIDHHEAAAQPLDVGEIVRGEHQRRVAGVAEAREEAPHRLLAHHVEADRRLVEEQHLRAVQQRRRELAAHALTERELAHRRLDERVEVEQLAALREPRCVLGGGNAVDVAQQRERITERQIPPELRALAEHDADPARELQALGHRLVAAHARESAGRIQHAREHLERRRFSGAVRADVAERLAALHGEVDAVDGADHARLAAQPSRLPVHGEVLPKSTRLDDGIHDPVLA